MNIRMDQIDEISVLATKYIADEFEFHGDKNPPEITPGMARNVLKAMISVSNQNGLPLMEGEIRRCSNCAQPAVKFFSTYALCHDCAKSS